MDGKWGIGLGTAAPTATIFSCFSLMMADESSAITLHTAPDSLRRRPGQGAVRLLRLSVYDWRGMGLEMAQPRRRFWQSAAGQAVVGPCPSRAVEGP